MVTPLQSVRLQTSQFLLKALKETEQEPQSASSTTRSALLKRYGIETTSSASETQGTLSSLLATLSARTTVAETVVDPISTDIRTASFMQGLKQSLEETKDTSRQSFAILKALNDGTLTVTNPLKGVAVTAWDVDSASEETPTGKAGETAETAGWSAFLKSHLTRGDTGSYAKTADGSFIDVATGNNAYFGTIGSTYVYLTWPQAKAAA